MGNLGTQLQYNGGLGGIAGIWAVWVPSMPTAGADVWEAIEMMNKLKDLFLGGGGGGTMLQTKPWKAPVLPISSSPTFFCCVCVCDCHGMHWAPLW